MVILIGKELNKIYRKLLVNNPTRLDAILYFITLIFCYFVFNQPDLLHYAGSSFTYLNGHINDFYEINRLLLIAPDNVLPTVYMFFAIWNIPIKLLGIVNQATMEGGYVIFWYKLLTTLFFAGSAFCFYKIGKAIGLNKANSILLTTIWISSPILIFSQFIFGQTDIFTIFFVLLGLYYFIKSNIWLFILFFSIAITFKYFPMFIFIPLILLVEKNPKKIFLYFTSVLIPTCLQVIFYAGSSAFWTDVIGARQALPRLTTAFITVGPDINIYLFLLFWFIICGLCYYLKPIEDKNKFYQTVFYVCLLVSCVLFILISWHPQWVLFITPFLAITTFMHRKIKEFLFLDLIMMLAFIGVSVTVGVFQMNVDQEMFKLGVLGRFNMDLFDPEKTLRMAKLFILGKNMYSTLFVSLLMLNILCKFPNKANQWSGDDNLAAVGTYWNYARLRFFGGMAIFIIPAFICFFYTLK